MAVRRSRGRRRPQRPRRDDSGHPAPHRLERVEDAKDCRGPHRGGTGQAQRVSGTLACLSIAEQMSDTLTYIAGPYSKPDPAENTRIAVEYGEKVWALGLVPYVPHLTHYWETLHFPHP